MNALRFYIFFLIGMLFFSSNLFAQQFEAPPLNTDGFEAREYVGPEGDTLRYRLMVPDNYDENKEYPLVLFLHGAGERGSDNKSQLLWGVRTFARPEFVKEHPAIVLAPQCPKEVYWAFNNWRGQGDLRLSDTLSTPLELTMDVHEQLRNEFSVDDNRLYVTGLSMGGFGTWDLIQRFPDLWAAAVPVCGGGDPSKVERIADLPIWNFHGGLDDVVPPELSRAMIEALHYAGGTPGYTEYPHVGHFAWVPAYQDSVMLEWLFEQDRGR